MVHRQARERFNAALELVRQAGVVGTGSLLQLELGLCGGEFALDEFFFLWAASKLGRRGGSGGSQRLQPPQLGHLGAGVGPLLEAAQGLEGGGRIGGGCGGPAQAPLGITVGARRTGSLWAVALTGGSSGLMGCSGSSHGASLR